MTQVILKQSQKPTELHVFETFDKKRALVFKLDCPYLLERHKYLMQKYNLTYDYDGYIGVPISFIEKYNPNQFDIIDEFKPVVNGVSKYDRIIIKNNYL